MAVTEQFSNHILPGRDLPLFRSRMTPANGVIGMHGLRAEKTTFPQTMQATGSRPSAPVDDEGSNRQGNPLCASPIPSSKADE